MTDIENDTLTGGVDANGVPLVASAAGQGLGSAQDAGTLGTACITVPDVEPDTVDTDADGIVNSLDLDDDNDGILDDNEDACFEAQIEWTHNGDNGQSESATYTDNSCLLYTSPSPRDLSTSRMPSSA